MANICEGAANNIPLAKPSTSGQKERISVRTTEQIVQAQPGPSGSGQQKLVSIKIEETEEKEKTCHLNIPKVTASSSSETLTG